MEIKPNPERYAKLIANIKEVSGIGEVREGIHLSDLTRCITKSFWDKYGKQKMEVSDQTALYFLMGFGLEKMLRGNIPAPQPGVCDDVHYSPDHLDDEFKIFDEIKSTRMGWKKDGDEPSKGWPQEWIRRAMGYCYATKTTTWGYDVFLIIPAELKVMDFTFELGELQEFWEEYIIPRRDELVKALETGIAPEAFSFNDDWECDRCEHLLLCENAKAMAGIMEANNAGKD